MGKNLSTLSIIGNCPTLVSHFQQKAYLIHSILCLPMGDINGNKITLPLNEAKVSTIGFKIQIVK